MLDLSRRQFGRFWRFVLVFLSLNILGAGCRSTKDSTFASGLEQPAISFEAEEGLNDLRLHNAFAYIAEETRSKGGITYDLKAKRKVEIGAKAYAVSLKGGKILPASASESRIASAAEELVLNHLDDFFLRGHMLGTWIDETSNQLHIDRTLLLYYSPATRDETFRSCVDVAKREEQKSVFDMATGQVIPVR